MNTPRRIISGRPDGEHLWLEADEQGVRLGARAARYQGGEVVWQDVAMVSLTPSEWEIARKALGLQVGT